VFRAEPVRFIENRWNLPRWAFWVVLKMKSKGYPMSKLQEIGDRLAKFTSELLTSQEIAAKLKLMNGIIEPFRLELAVNEWLFGHRWSNSRLAEAVAYV
jgi:hypothetical protein